jgi:predicted ABC-type ATPase
VIVLLNGAFGIGKTTVARLLVARLQRAVLFDPEWIGIPLQRVTRVDDFQDLRAWRRATVAGLRVVRAFRRNVIAPMAFSNAGYLREIREGVSRFEPRVLQFCLVAPVEVVHERLRRRGDAGAWEYRRARECCLAHESEDFAVHIDAADRPPGAIADELLAVIESL